MQFTDNALRLIAKKALAKNTGARGLRALLENILIEAMFEVPIAISVPSIIYWLHLPLVLKTHSNFQYGSPGPNVDNRNIVLSVMCHSTLCFSDPLYGQLVAENKK